MMPGLGRRWSPDARDTKYPMRAVLPDLPSLPYKYWSHKGILDQGNTGTCVAFAWYSLWMGSPKRNRAKPDFSPYNLYRLIVKLDEWTQNDHEATAPDSGLQFGSSIRAGAKAAFALKWIEGSYVWGHTVEEMNRFNSHIGPVVNGTVWTNAMFQPDAEGIVRYTGRIVGGHAYVRDGFNLKRGLGRYRQSWGYKFAKNGMFWIPMEDEERLLADDGDCCSAVEVLQA